MAKAGYREKKIRPVWPIYAAGAIFVIYSAIAPIYKPSHFVIACVLAIAAYVAGTIFSPAKVEQVEVDYKTGNNDADAIIVRGRETTARLRDAFTRITDPELKTYVSRTERALTRMIDTVAQTPAKAAHVKKFVNYYLPTIVKLLDAYDRLCEAGQSDTMKRYAAIHRKQHVQRGRRVRKAARQHVRGRADGHIHRHRGAGDHAQIRRPAGRQAV